MFQKHLCPHGAQFRFIPPVEAKSVRASKQGIKICKVYINVTNWAQKSGLTLEHVT